MTWDDISESGKNNNVASKVEINLWVPTTVDHGRGEYAGGDDEARRLRNQGEFGVQVPQKKKN